MVGAAGIARRLGGRRQGHRNWRCACPANCGYDVSLADAADGKLLAYCFGGCEFSEILSALDGMNDDVDGPDPIHDDNGSIIRRRDDAERIAGARQIYDCGDADERIGIYLRSRGITLTSPVLRFSEAAPHRLGFRRPALLAPVTDANGIQVGTHLTFLRPDASAKADLDNEFQRECRGVIRGGAIRLAPHDPERELLIAEGAESGLAAMQIFGLPTWAAVYAANLKNTLELPAEVRRVVIAGDNDLSGAGQQAALEAYRRWTAEGRAVRIVMPPRIGTDFNDVLLARR